MTQQIDHAVAKKLAEVVAQHVDQTASNLARAYLAHAETIRELQARVKELETLISRHYSDIMVCCDEVDEEAKAIQQRERRVKKV